MLPFGGFPGGNQADIFWAVLLQAQLTDLLSPGMQFTSEHKRSPSEKMEKSFFPLSSPSSFLSKEAPVCLWYSEQDEDQTLIWASAKTGRQTFIHLQSKCFYACCPSNAYFLIPLCLKEFSQFVRDEERWRERERLTDRDKRKRESRAERDHFSVAPRGFSKAFSKKTSGCVMDQTAAAATSQPTQQTTGFDISVTIRPCVASFLYTSG